MLFEELLKAVTVSNISNVHNPSLKGVTHDSRLVEPGFLFVAVKGFKSDGHHYIRQAIDRGAVAVVVEEERRLPEGISWARVDDTRLALALLSAKYFGNPSLSMTMVGVTGTNGKTTTTNMIAEVLKTSGRKVGLIGTINNIIGEKVLPVSHTTPESPELQNLLSQMVKEGVSACVMEVSSHALKLHRVEGCVFDAAVFTNLTQDHLDLHGSMEDYLEAKLKLFRGLSNSGDKEGPALAVINADDQYSGKFVRAAGENAIYTYGINGPADVLASDIRVNARGVGFTITGKCGGCTLNLKLAGKFNVYNALAAFTVSRALGIPVPHIKTALENMAGVPGRFELVNAGQDFSVIVDYAHTPDGLDNILTTARQITEGRLITVFGCGGDRDRTKRPVMGEIAGRHSDITVITSDNPRTEDPMNIIRDIESGLMGTVAREDYLVEPDRRKAIRLAVGKARQGDVVVIAGKGHEDYQIIGTTKYPFDDRVEADAAIREGIG